MAGTPKDLAYRFVITDNEITKETKAINDSLAQMNKYLGQTGKAYDDLSAKEKRNFNDQIKAMRHWDDYAQQAAKLLKIQMELSKAVAAGHMEEARATEIINAKTRAMAQEFALAQRLKDQASGSGMRGGRGGVVNAFSPTKIAAAAAQTQTFWDSVDRARMRSMEAQRVAREKAHEEALRMDAAMTVAHGKAIETQMAQEAKLFRERQAAQAKAWAADPFNPANIAARHLERSTGQSPSPRPRAPRAAAAAAAALPRLPLRATSSRT